jgi:hypothetical protein
MSMKITSTSITRANTMILLGHVGSWEKEGCGQKLQTQRLLNLTLKQV